MALQTGVALNDDGRAVSSMGAEAKDVDNDGREDLFVTANNNETFPLFRNLGRGLLSDITYTSEVGRQSLTRTGWGNGAFDFDNDGNKDLFAACGAIDNNVEAFSNRSSRQRNIVLSNLGTGRFRDVSAAAGADFQIAARHRGAAFGDFDRDGRMDVVVTRIGESASLWRNISNTRNHWLGIRLRGAGRNFHGMGAMVHVVSSSGREQWNRMTTATGYGSSSEPILIFGMGGDAVAAMIEIRWPSGAVNTLTRVACDRYLTIEERTPRERRVRLEFHRFLQTDRCLISLAEVQQDSSEFRPGAGRLGLGFRGVLQRRNCFLQPSLAKQERPIIDPRIFQ
jgi:hypothetical protein